MRRLNESNRRAQNEQMREWVWIRRSWAQPTDEKKKICSDSAKESAHPKGKYLSLSILNWNTYYKSGCAIKMFYLVVFHIAIQWSAWLAKKHTGKPISYSIAFIFMLSLFTPNLLSTIRKRFKTLRNTTAMKKNKRRTKERKIERRTN